MRVALGISGGIAAYKAAELLRLLQERGRGSPGGDDPECAVNSSLRSLLPLSPAEKSSRKCLAADRRAAANVESAIEHIAVAQSIDALVIAPATANVLAKMAHGIADDFLTTLCLATKAPLIAAPAMNVNMWEHPATQKNVEILRERGVKVLPPDEGYLACGMTGAGRLTSVESIAKAVFETLGVRGRFGR